MSVRLDVELARRTRAITNGDFLLQAAGCTRCAWPLNSSVKCSHFRFEFAEGQNTKIQSKYQNSFQAQNAKISAVSTPILTRKAAFSAFFKFYQKNKQKTCKTSEIARNLLTKIRKYDYLKIKCGNFECILGSPV